MNDDAHKNRRRGGLHVVHWADAASETCAPLRRPEPVRGRVGIQKEVQGLRYLGATDPTRAVVSRAAVLIVALTLAGVALMAVPKRERLTATAQAGIAKAIPASPETPPVVTADQTATADFCAH
jgi:hypothetical protein